MITTMTGKNQITIPAQLVRTLDIKPGTRLDWSVGEDGELIAQILPDRGELARQLAGIGRPWLEDGEDPIAELDRERADDDHVEGLT